MSENKEHLNGLGAQIGLFITFKHTMGATYDSGECYLRRFERWCTTHGVTTMTRQACEGFVAFVDAGRGDTDRGWVSYLRGFARWMRTHGDREAYILPSHFTPHKPRPDTYLLSQAEIDAFFTATTVYQGTQPWPWQATAFFITMCCLGLRTAEARHLDRADVDLDALTVTVHNSKGPKTRVLPMTTEVAEVLANCDEHNNRAWPTRQAFFVSSTGVRLQKDRPPNVFRQVWNDAWLVWPSEPPYPRPYDLRHRFAYANLERWATQGQDTAVLLPYLARYMGHASTQTTLYYMHISPDFIITWQASEHPCADLLPKAGFDD